MKRALGDPAPRAHARQPVGRRFAPPQRVAAAAAIQLERILP